MGQEDPSGYPYQPYGAPYGEQPPPQYGYGYGTPPPRNDGPSANAIVALVLNLVAVVSCCNVLGIPGAILAGLAIGRSRTEPRTARTMITWSWVLFGLGFVVTIGTFLALGFSGAFDD
ncbi:hypothetical protein GCM10022224_091750 [Nonomuraea antimicrobica]|uniref:DUF4190 domain-containing protein n=1 Tax=Nonomuraea antimicrobica TaxID=561173 RepID=A0ABP7E0Z1_9ACTN